MIEWIVTSSLLILLVSALRLAVKGRVSPRLRYALWAVVLLRLLVPGQLIRLPAAMPAVPEVPQVAERLEQESIYVLPVQTTPVEDADLVTVRDGAVVEDASPFGYARLEDEGRTVVRYARRFSPIEILRAVWLTGTAAVAGFFLAVNLRFYLRLRRSRRPLPAYGGRLVYAVEGIVSPCLFGLLDPAIYLTPDCAESESARRHILAHELTHYRQGDHLWAILRGAALALHWYNPLVWWAAAMSRRDCELSCDAGAVRLLGEDQRADYGRTLVALVTRRTQPADLISCATTMTGGKSEIKERIAVLVKRQRTTVLMLCAVVLVAAVAVACSFAVAEKDEPAPDQADSSAETPDVEISKGEAFVDGNDVLNLVERQPGEELAVLDAAGDRILVAVEQRYDENHPYFREVGLNRYTKRLVLVDMAAGTVEEAERFSSDSTYCAAGQLKENGVVYQLIRNDGKVPYLYSLTSRTNDVYVRILSEGRTANYSTIDVEILDDKTVIHTFSGIEDGTSGFVVTTSGMKELYRQEWPAADEPHQLFDKPIFSNGKLFATKALVDGGVSLVIGDADGIKTRIPLAEGELCLDFCLMEDSFLYTVRQENGDETTEYMTITDLDGKPLARVEQGGSAPRDLCYCGSNVVAAKKDGLVKLYRWELGEGLLTVAETEVGDKYTKLYGLGDGGCLIFDYFTECVTKLLMEIVDDMNREPEWIEEVPVPTIPTASDLRAAEPVPDNGVGYTDYWLLAELPEHDIALYCVNDGGAVECGEGMEEYVYLRVGDWVQAFRQDHLTPRMELPEMYYKDLDGDGERELGVVYYVGSGTGCSVEELVVYEQTGGIWEDYRHDLTDLLADFNQRRFYLLNEEEQTAEIRYNGACAVVDVSERLLVNPDRKLDQCCITGLQTDYAWADGKFQLTLAGEIKPSHASETLNYAFQYGCPVTYNADGTFTEEQGWIGGPSK